MHVLGDRGTGALLAGAALWRTPAAWDAARALQGRTGRSVLFVQVMLQRWARGRADAAADALRALARALAERGAAVPLARLSKHAC